MTQYIRYPKIGNVTGPTSSLTGDIVVFGDTTGQLIADSGYSIASLIGSITLQQAYLNNSSADPQITYNFGDNQVNFEIVAETSNGPQAPGIFFTAADIRNGSGTGGIFIGSGGAATESGDTGGSAQLLGGDATNKNCTSGFAYVSSGAANESTSGISGYTLIQTGGATMLSGDLYIKTGTAIDTSSISGNIELTTGAADTLTGSITAATGNSPNNNSGSYSFTTGSGTSSGDINFTTGPATDDHSGSMLFQIGDSVSDAGSFQFNGSSTPANFTAFIISNCDYVYTGGDHLNFVLATTNGTKWGTLSTHKQAWWGATAIVQPVNTTAIDTLLANTGLRATGGFANFATTLKPRAGTSTANTAPVLFTSGTNLTVPVAGAMEYNGELFFSPSTTRYKFAFLDRAQTWSDNQTFSAGKGITFTDLSGNPSPTVRLGSTNILTYTGFILDDSSDWYFYFDTTSTKTVFRQTANFLGAVINNFTTLMNVNSTSALIVERTGTNPDVLHVDTTNNCVGIGVAPNSGIQLLVADSAKSKVMQVTQTHVTRVAAATAFNSVGTYSWTGGATTINQFAGSIVDSRVVNSGVADSLLCLNFSVSKSGTGSSTATTANTINVNNSTGSDSFTYTRGDTTGQNVICQVNVANVNFSPTIAHSAGAGHIVTATIAAQDAFLNSYTPIVNSGDTLNTTAYLSRVRGTASAASGAGTHNSQGFAYYSSFGGGFGTNWCFYNDASAAMNSWMGLDNAKLYFGTGSTAGTPAVRTPDASIYFDGTDLIIDGDEVSTGTVKFLSNITMSAQNMVTDTTTGTQLATSTTQKIGMHGVAVAQDTGWGSITNVTTDRAYDANATTIDELADVLGTLIAKLVAKGVIGA